MKPTCPKCGSTHFGTQQVGNTQVYDWFCLNDGCDFRGHGIDFLPLAPDELPLTPPLFADRDAAWKFAKRQLKAQGYHSLILWHEPFQAPSYNDAGSSPDAIPDETHYIPDEPGWYGYNLYPQGRIEVEQTTGRVRIVEDLKDQVTLPHLRVGGKS